MAGEDAQTRSIEVHQIRPYASAVILEYQGASGDAFLERLAADLRRLKLRPRAGRSATIIASGLTGIQEIITDADSTGYDVSAVEADGFVTEVNAPPSWALQDAGFMETGLDLTILLRRSRLVAIRCDTGLVDAIQTWLDKPPKPQFRRVPAPVLNAALLTGEAKGLWLRGTHARRTTKADTKNISGRRLQDALNPLEDSSFAMGSARALLPTGQVIGTASKTVGTTPRKSLVWVSRTDNFKEFVHIMLDLLALLDGALQTGASLESPYPWLATELRDLSEVHDAFEIVTLTPDEIPSTPDWSDDAVAASELLERVTFDVIGKKSDAEFTADVALDGSLRGRLRCTINDDQGVVSLNFGHEGSATDPATLQMVVDALRFTDLPTVYYESGHAISAGHIWSTAVRAQPFPGWEWGNFENFDITTEKPSSNVPQQIHDMIGEAGDRSLFAWVLHRYANTGWLTCDDGANEIADFVRYEGDGTITLIHVKRSNSYLPKRPVNVTAYEQVASQATKNLAYLDTEILCEKLRRPLVSRPACWYNGSRVADRTELIEYMRIRRDDSPWRVVIVQPQMTKWKYDTTKATSIGGVEVMRLRLLETILNSAIGAIHGVGAQMAVIADAST